MFEKVRKTTPIIQAVMKTNLKKIITFIKLIAQLLPEQLCPRRKGAIIDTV